MSEHTCPLCARGTLHRSERRGFVEMHVLPLFGKFPWRCNVCHKRVSIADRGARLYVRGDRKREPSDATSEQAL